MFLIEAVEEPVLKESRAQGPNLVARGAEVEGRVDLAAIGDEEGGGGSAVEEEVGLGDGAGGVGDGGAGGVAVHRSLHG